MRIQVLGPQRANAPSPGEGALVAGHELLYMRGMSHVTCTGPCRSGSYRWGRWGQTLQWKQTAKKETARRAMGSDGGIFRTEVESPFVG